MLKFKFSPEVRAGELIAAIAVVGGGIGVWTDLNTKVAVISSAQASQAVATREMKDDFRNVTNEIKGEIRDMRREMRPRSAGQM
jgi:hypothetical protein